MRMLEYYLCYRIKFMRILAKILGDPNEKVIKSLKPTVEKINSLEKNFKALSDQELKDYSQKLKDQVASSSDKTKQAQVLDEILPEAFALAREASRRTLGLRHYDVQLIGGIVLHQGQIAEMKTGEGKTLVASLPLYLNALTGRGVHLVTVNDYLARIGAGWMAPIYHFLGLTVSVITQAASYIYDPDYNDDSQYDERLKHLKPVEKKEAYQADIVYGTNNEFGFDYLRDNMVMSLDQCVQRELYYAIVDEVDSILIDEARTPLIISAPAEESTDKYYRFAELVARLKEGEDYNVDEKMRTATLTEAGISKMEKWLGVDNIYTSGGIRDAHHIDQALKARTLFHKDQHYVVKDGEVIIVDEFTGRLMPGRRYSEGLHQAIEAKEGVKIQRESQTLATITFQNYFRLYEKLAGMTGTAVTEAEEFAKIYNLETVVIPTHRPMIRKDLNDLIYKTEAAKFKAVVEEVKRRQAKGQPVLVGTISIEKNEILAQMLERAGVRPNVLNAKNHEKEAQIIAQAGRLGAVTIATNMAGRGVDIILGGNPPDKEEQEKVKALGGLHVIGTERHESRRIDNQLRGRAGRQGDPGSSQFFVSLEDDLMRIFGGDRMKKMMTTLRVPEDMPIENKLISKSIEAAQKKVEGNNFDIRKHLVEYDDVINKHREAIYRRRRQILEISQKQENKETSSSSTSDKDLSDKPQTLTDIILGLVEAEIEKVVTFHTAGEYLKDWNLAEIYEVMSTIFPVEKNLQAELEEMIKSNDKLNKAKVRTKIIEYLVSLAHKHYDNLASAARAAGIDWVEIEKQVLLRAIDTLWTEHLEAMDYMRRGIGLRGYGQRDPLIEYKREAYRMFNELNDLIQKQVAYTIYKIGGVENFAAPSLVERDLQLTAPPKTAAEAGSSFSAFAPSGGNMSSTADQNLASAQTVSQPVISRKRDKNGKKIGRNDPCPCGSGKKYKKCCGR